MKYASVQEFTQNNKAALAKGPVALIFAEDRTELATTIRHHQGLGFQQILVFMSDAFDLDDELAQTVHRIRLENVSGQPMIDVVNHIIMTAPNIWLYYCYNAEYLFYPFCETRTVGELTTFQMEERREAILTYVIDLYAGDLESHPDAVSLEEAQMDKSGYYALARPDPENHNHPKERQLDFFGGLRWRYEEHIPSDKRKIDRISLFQNKPGLVLNSDLTFNDQEYNTYSCEWHNNITTAICSFRTAKALKTNPGSTFDISTFRWHNSVPFEWHSRQLLDLGLMEPGQWF